MPDSIAMTLARKERAPADPHPLPWRWERWSVAEDLEPPSDVWNLRDAGDGILLVVPEENCKPSPYVRAVTERAGAMERALLRMVERAFPRMADGELGRCIYCASLGGPPQARHYPECPVAPAATLLAEIDAAKGSVVAK